MGELRPRPVELPWEPGPAGPPSAPPPAGSYAAARAAAAGELLRELRGSAAFDRLCDLAARLLGTAHAQVSLLTDVEVVVGGHGLADGVVGTAVPLERSLAARVAALGGPLAVEDATADPDLAGVPEVAARTVVAYLGVPLRTAAGHLVGVLAGWDGTARGWSADAVTLLGQLGDSVVAELELATTNARLGASLTRLDVALEASSVGIWEHDLRAGRMQWDERCAALFGLEGPVTFGSLEAALARVHPDDRATVVDAMREAVEGRGTYSAESRAVHPDGTVRWTVSSGRVLADATGHPALVLGTVVDVTEAREQSAQRLAAVQRAAAVAEVAASTAGATGLDGLAELALRGAQVLGAVSSGLAVFEPDGRLVLRLTRGLVAAVRDVAAVELPVGGVPVPLDDRLPTQWAARHGERVLLGGAAEAVERFPAMAELQPIVGVGALAATPLRVEGRVLGAVVAVWEGDHAFPAEEVELLDALAAQLAQAVSRLQADAERDRAVDAMAAANRRLRLLAETGHVLSGTLDVDEQVRRLAGLVVPALGDWCWIAVTDEHGRLHEAGGAHRDPSRTAEVEAYTRSMLAHATEDTGALVAVRSGRPWTWDLLDDDAVTRALPDPDTRARLRALGPASGVVLPLTARGRPLGALGVLSGPDRPPLTADEVDTVAEVARRAGLALQTARLYGQQRGLAESLQRGLLTAPAQPASGELAVRYVPAAEGAQVGGDWYDAFPGPRGGTVLTIGDVAGHDSGAAAAMGQLRGLLRGISLAGDGSPAAVLGELDRAAEVLGLRTLATAVLGRLEPAEGGAVFRWANAGHPPPVVLGVDGAVRVLEDPSGVGDLLLGVHPGAARSDHSAPLRPGETLLLHTDGLVERRDRDVEAGTAELLRVLGELAGLPPGELCDLLLARMFGPDAEDDVAVLAVRV